MRDLAGGLTVSVDLFGIPITMDHKLSPPGAHEYPAKGRKSSHDDCVGELLEEGRAPDFRQGSGARSVSSPCLTASNAACVRSPAPIFGRIALTYPFTVPTLR